MQNDISSDQEAHCLAILYEEALHLIVREEVKSPRQLKDPIAMGSRERNHGDGNAGSSSLDESL